ncbi:MAG: hypothetical protein ACP5PV_05495 [Methanothrix sp.]
MVFKQGYNIVTEETGAEASEEMGQSQMDFAAMMQTNIPQPPDVEPKADQAMGAAPAGGFVMGAQSTAPSAVDMGLLNGCFGFASVFQLCWNVNIAGQNVTVSLKIAGISVGSWTLDTSRTCINISFGIPYVGKIGARICVDWAQRRIYLNGKACYYKWFSGWKCATLGNVVIASW